MSEYIYNKIYDIYKININNNYKNNTLQILLNIIDKNIYNYDYEFNIIFNKYIINFKSNNIYSLYYGLYIFDNIESLYSILRCSNDIELFNELSNYLLEIKNKHII